MVKDAALREMISGRRLTLIGEGFSQIESVFGFLHNLCGLWE